MNHMFTLHNSKGVQVFLPIDSVLKLDNNPPNVPGHPYNTRSKDKHNVDPAATLNLIHNYSKIEGRSQKEFMLEQRKHHEEIKLKNEAAKRQEEAARRQEEAAKRQEKQSSAPGKDFDVHKVNIDEQKRLYEAAQRASKQGGEGQNQTKSGMDANSGRMDNLQQHGGIHHQPSGNQQGSSVDPTGHGYHDGQKQIYGLQAPQYPNQQPGYHQGSIVNVGQQQFQGSQVHQHHNQQPDFYQGPNVDHTSYGHNVGQQPFHGSQVPQPQNQQPGYYRGPNVDPTGYGQNVGEYGSQVPHHQNQQPGYNYPDVPNYPNQSVSQPPHPYPDPVTQMAHIPRAGEGGSDLHYNPATGMPRDHNGDKSQGPHRQVSHQYEPVPGPVDQPNPHSQHHQQHPASNQPNPYNLEEGSMILYGDPPCPGIIKWLGYLPEVSPLTAGVEMVSICMYVANVASSMYFIMWVMSVKFLHV